MRKMVNGINTGRVSAGDNQLEDKLAIFLLLLNCLASINKSREETSEPTEFWKRAFFASLAEKICRWTNKNQSGVGDRYPVLVGWWHSTMLVGNAFRALKYQFGYFHNGNNPLYPDCCYGRLRHALAVPLPLRHFWHASRAFSHLSGRTAIAVDARLKPVRDVLVWLVWSIWQSCTKWFLPRYRHPRYQ